MNKEKFCAIYNGECYIKGYGRKFYKKGIELINIENCDGKIVVEKARMNMTETFKKCSDIANGTRIRFDAVLTDNKISYISNVETVDLYGGFRYENWNNWN